MQTKSKIISAVFSLLALAGCDGNYRNVSISGYIKDTDSQIPLAHANVVLKCWVYNPKISESEIVEQTTTTDANGYFQSTFEKAEAVDILVTAPGYAPKEQSYTMRKNKLNLDIFLEDK